MKRAALFVGINDYIKPLTSLKCARKDADTLYRLFLEQYSPGMVDYLHDVDSDEIIKSVEKTIAQLDPGDLFFFYFSGHGIEERNNHYLLTSSARQFGDEWQHALSVNKLKYLTRKAGVQSVFIIDSCREAVYMGSRSTGAAEQSRGATMKKIVNEGAQDASFLSPVIFCSCSGGERAFEVEETGHGIFTLALKECLESNHFFTLDEIARDVTERLKKLIKKFNFSGQQTPDIQKTPTSNPCLWGARTSAPTPVASARDTSCHETHSSLLSIEDLEKYYTLLEQLRDDVEKFPDFRQRFAAVEDLFSKDDQEKAYQDLQKIQTDLKDRKLAVSFEILAADLAKSYPQQLMDDYKLAKDYKIKLNTANNLFRTKRFTEALKKLDELSALQESARVKDSARRQAEAAAAAKKQAEAAAAAKKQAEAAAAAKRQAEAAAAKQQQAAQYKYVGANSSICTSIENSDKTTQRKSGTASQSSTARPRPNASSMRPRPSTGQTTTLSHPAAVNNSATVRHPAADDTQFIPKQKTTAKKTQPASNGSGSAFKIKPGFLWRFLSFLFYFVLAHGLLLFTATYYVNNEKLIAGALLVLYIVGIFWKMPYFGSYTLFAVATCLSVFFSPWFLIAVAVISFFIFCFLCCCDKDASRFIHFYLALLQTFFVCVILHKIGLNSYLNISLVLFSSTVFFPLISKFPKIISFCVASACVYPALKLSPWWWIGTCLFLFVLFCVWGNDYAKKEAAEKDNAA